MIKVEDLLVLLVFGYLRYIWWKRTILLATLMGGYKSKLKTKGKKNKQRGKRMV